MAPSGLIRLASVVAVVVWEGANWNMGEQLTSAASSRPACASALGDIVVWYSRIRVCDVGDAVILCVECKRDLLMMLNACCK